jgi:uncharacterized protein YeaO (DUF488 family)
LEFAFGSALADDAVMCCNEFLTLVRTSSKCSAKPAISFYGVERGAVTSIKLKRVYEPPAASDGTRILVDRLWPRGISKDKARIDLWLKEVAPSGSLRKRFHGKPEDWDAFCKAYYSELQAAAAHAAAEDLLDRVHSGAITLLYAARDEQRNNAVALKAWLERHSKRPR